MIENELQKEDYIEPVCPLCLPTQEAGPRIPIDRVLHKLDSYFASNDYSGALRHLLYWEGEATLTKDKRGLITVCNELMGLYRKEGKEKEAIAYAEKALSLLAAEGREDSGVGTTLLNAATVYKAFGRAEEALPLYRRAEELYSRYLPEGDGRFGGLYNNLALCLTDLSRYTEAEEYYRRALSVMERVEGGELERAITYLNLADLKREALPLEEAAPLIEEYVNTAQGLLESPRLLRDGYYAFVCEKCAESFRYYGHFAYADELLERARSIYAGA